MSRGILCAAIALVLNACAGISNELPPTRFSLTGGNTPEDGQQQAPDRKRSGKWITRDGRRICDGYLTRREDQDFCVAEVPSDWVPFDFGGNRYYIAPLSAAPGANATPAVRSRRAH